MRSCAMCASPCASAGCRESRSRGRAVIEQLQGRLRALGEELIGQGAVGQRPGQLQGADQQAQEGERVGSCRVGVVRLQAGGDVVGGGEEFVGEDILCAGGPADDLVEQRGGGAAVGALVAVLGGEVCADERFEPGAIGGRGAEALALNSQLLGEDVGDEILLGGEVGVEGAVGQAGVGHHGGGAVAAVLFEAPSGRFEDALSGRLLLVLGVAHREPLSSNWSRSCWDYTRPAIALCPYYCSMVVLRSERGTLHVFQQHKQVRGPGAARRRPVRRRADASIVNVALPSMGRTSGSRRTTCRGSSTRTCSCSAASCCLAVVSPTCSAVAVCSSVA